MRWRNIAGVSKDQQYEMIGEEDAEPREHKVGGESCEIWADGRKLA
jgi:hypothetical protein